MKKDIYIKNKKGFILVLTLTATLLPAALIIGLLSISAIDVVLIKNHIYSLKAYYIAEAGVADAINQIRQNGPMADTQWNSDFPAGTQDTYSVSVSDSSTTISATGTAYASNFSRMLDVKVEISGSSAPYNVAIRQWKEVVQ